LKPVFANNYSDTIIHSIISIQIATSHFPRLKFAGFVTSFLVNPIERIKILMQSDKTGVYKSEIDCAVKVIREDGLKGLLVRGLDATLAREIPGYGLYFVAYSLLMQSSVGLALGPTFSPLVCGAAAGCLSWIPVFPFDVIKTYVGDSVRVCLS
jgi:solute carrier family 25 (mitochondrial carnitine/acylcarnitine transporter), member 20/29